MVHVRRTKNKACREAALLGRAELRDLSPQLSENQLLNPEKTHQEYDEDELMVPSSPVLQPFAGDFFGSAVDYAMDDMPGLESDDEDEDEGQDEGQDAGEPGVGNSSRPSSLSNREYG